MNLADDRFNQRLHTRLLSNAAAMQALEAELGIGQRIADRFRLGLSEPYPKSSSTERQVIHQDVLVAPVVGEDGRYYSRYVYRHLAPITIDNRIDPPDSWCAGPSETYFSRRCRADDSLIVCENVFDLWTLMALIQDSSLERSHVVIAPTRCGKWPAAWESKEFWVRWRRVNLAIRSGGKPGEDASHDLDKRARTLAQLMDRDVHRVPPHDAPDWLAARKSGISYDVFHRLLKSAMPLKPEDLRVDEAERYTSAASEDLSCSYQRGFLFEAIRVLERDEIEGQCSERYRTVIVRSDRTLHRIEQMPSPPGTARSERVFRLVPDGALLRRVPTPSTDSTWRWKSVHAYLYQAGVAPPLAMLLDQIAAHLRASVWLPFQADYLLLACTVAATYCQQIFEAVPLILVTGAKGSGKTELSIAISKLCANSPGPVGLISAATLTRLVDASHGFVAIDDLEKIMAKRGSDPRFCDLTQTLKLSYKKESAQRMLTDVNQNNELQRLNFFGIKLVNNTSGADDILGSRMLRISTRQMPVGATLAREGRMDSEQCAQLRDHLHVWAFTHVTEIARTYTQIFPCVSTRNEEIFAPIRVVAQLSGSAALRREVDEAIGATRLSTTVSATDAMEDALLAIVTKSITNGRGLRTVVTVLEAQMRLKLREGRQFGKTNTTDISDIESPEWIGRQFKDVFAPAGAVPIRLEMLSRGTRAYQLREDLLERATKAANVQRSELVEVADPRAFCISCSTCDYQEICEMRTRKEKAEVSSDHRSRPKASGVENRGSGEAGLH